MSKYIHKDKKFAKTKLNLLDALIALLKNKSLEAVKLTDICERAGVSYATFFNYFKKKEDLLIYFIQLWSVEVSHEARKISLESSGLRAIEEVFLFTARQCEKGPEIMTEIISFQARQSRKQIQVIKPLTDVEKFIRFPHIEDFSELGDGGIGTIFPWLIRQAVETGEIPKATDTNALVYILASVFFGVPASIGPDKPNLYKAYYIKSLKLIWAGIQKIGEQNESNKQKRNHKKPFTGISKK